MPEQIPTKKKRPRTDAPEARVALRLVLGFFGGLFVAVSTHLAIRGNGDPLRERFAGVAAILGLMLGGTVIGLAAFAQHVALRVAAWSTAGAGLGNGILAFAVGGILSDDFFTPGGMVMAVVGAWLGYRTIPPDADELDSPPSSQGRKGPFRHAGVWIAFVILAVGALAIVFMQHGFHPGQPPAADTPGTNAENSRQPDGPNHTE